LKKEFAERYDVEYIRETIAHCKKYNIRAEDRMLVVPVPFSTEGAKMLQHSFKIEIVSMSFILQIDKNTSN